MSTPIPTPPVPAIPWYQSPVQKAQIASLLAALVALSPKIGQVIGISTPGAAAAWVENIFGAITLLAPLIGTILRARSKLQPLTLTQGKADVHPATIAAERAAAVSTPVFPATGVPHAPPPPPPPAPVSFSSPPKS